jgi:hypothetical protein
LTSISKSFAGKRLDFERTDMKFNKLLILIAIVISSFTFVGCSSDTFTISGTVTDRDTGEPINDLQICIQIRGGPHCDNTNVDGRYKISINKDDWVSEVCISDIEQLDYWTDCFELLNGTDQDKVFDIVANPIELD